MPRPIRTSSHRLLPLVRLAICLFSLALAGGIIFAPFPATGAPALPTSSPPPPDDGFDALPPGLKGISYSTLTHMGKVHPYTAPLRETPISSNPFIPLLDITWGLPAQTSIVTSGEPAAGMHPSNPAYALVTGNTTIDNTTDGGLTWQSQSPPNPSTYGDVVNAWLEPPGPNALVVSLNHVGSTTDYTCARSTDYGVTWATDDPCGVSASTTFFDDREYLWVDRNPSSPFYGRLYMTGALFGHDGTLDYNTVTNRWSSDNGVTWNPPSNSPIPIVASDELAQGIAHNEFPSLGISPDGTLGYAWHRGRCCNIITNVPNNVMFARSTDGGVTFPFSTTIVTVPVSQSIEFNSISPISQRWTDTPNIAADPSTNGVFYALWTQYRTPSTVASAAVYLSRTTDNGFTWSTPTIPYNNPDPNIFQGWGWVKVTADHTIHLTYLGGTTSNTAVAQFYIQSTDGGSTWSHPFQLGSSTFNRFGDTTDYESIDTSGAPGTPGFILATWAQNSHWARMGTFDLPIITPTPLSTSTATPTPSPPATFTTTPSPTQTSTLVPTNSPSPTSTPTHGTPTASAIVSVTPTPCSIAFTDVHSTDYFYQPVLYLACRSVISGYTSSPPCPSGGIPCFKPYNNSTRAQITKIVVLGFDKQIIVPPQGQYTFADVLPTSPFFSYIETAASLGIINGYPCGSPGEPCDPSFRPYFRPNNNVTRGQLSKLTVLAAGWPLSSPTSYHFEDILPGSTFFDYIETSYCHAIINGYPCGSLPTEPCNPPDNRPYFRPSNNATRGQAAKIIYLSILSPPSCLAAR